MLHPSSLPHFIVFVLLIISKINERSGWDISETLRNQSYNVLSTGIKPGKEGDMYYMYNKRQTPLPNSNV